MSECSAFCFNCQAELEVNESLYKRADADRESFTLPANTQGQTVYGHEYGLLGQSGNLLDIICNSSSALTAPICEDCTEHLLSEMDVQLRTLEEECSSYRVLLETLKANPGIYSLGDNDNATNLSTLKGEEAALQAELRKLEQEEGCLNQELNRKKDQVLNAEAEEEERLWMKFRDNHRKLLEMEREEQNIDSQLVCARAQLSKLSSLNVLNTAFHIWQQGNFGTINGFRLGRLPGSQVEWTEINAAWGQTSLLLTVLLKGLNGFRLIGYEVFPMGNRSFIRVASSGDDLPLYGSGGFKPFGQKKFDEAMCAFLECFCQLQRHIEGGSEFRLPHRMQKDHIEENKTDYSVKMQFNSEERWTKAMKCLLINLRWAISFVVTLRTFIRT